MTEDEAKKKWCPFARVGSSVSGLGSLNRDASPSDDSINGLPRRALCLGSACMAWRWVRFDRTAFVTPGVWTDAEGYAAAGPKGDLKRLGGCGLAGAPQ